MSMDEPELILIPIVGKLENMTDGELCYRLSRFIHEVRNQKGENYPAETVNELIAAVQMYLDLHGRQVKLYEDAQFQEVANTLDTRMKELVEQGDVRPGNQADEITEEMEDYLFAWGFLGSDTEIVGFRPFP